MYEAVSNILEAVAFLLQAWCLYYFFESFLTRRIAGKWLHLLAFTAAYALYSFVINLILPAESGELLALGKIALSLIALLSLVFAFYKPTPTMQVFLGVTFLAVNQISFFIAHILLQVGGNLFDLWTWMLEQKHITSIPAFEGLIEGTVILLFLLLHAARIALLYLSLRKISRNFREKEHPIHRTELLFILTPSLVGLLTCGLLRSVMIAVEDGLPRVLYDRYPSLTVLVPAILLLSLLSIQYGVKLYQDMIESNRQRSSNMILERQVAAMQEHFQEIERVYSGIRGMKHDMKNSLAVAMQLAGGGEGSELSAYLAGLNQSMDELDYRFKTGSGAVDALLNMKYHEAVRAVPGIMLDAEGLLFPSGLCIQSYDIAIILGNALDNAIAACKRLVESDLKAKPFIRLSSLRRGKMFLLTVENSFDGRLNLKKGVEFPVTDKDDRQSHGLGFLNMNNAAAKYHGGVDYKAMDGVFTLTVMMQDERRDEDEH